MANIVILEQVLELRFPNGSEIEKVIKPKGHIMLPLRYEVITELCTLKQKGSWDFDCGLLIETEHKMDSLS